MEQSEVEDIFSVLGPVTIKRMFGGKAIYCRGNIIAVELRGDIWLKADDVSAPEFAAAGAIRWTYEGKMGRTVAMPYWSIPADAFDDPAHMARWVKLAHAAALRSATVKKRTRRSDEIKAGP